MNLYFQVPHGSVTIAWCFLYVAGSFLSLEVVANCPHDLKTV